VDEIFERGCVFESLSFFWGERPTGESAEHFEINYLIGNCVTQIYSFQSDDFDIVSSRDYDPIDSPQGLRTILISPVVSYCYKRMNFALRLPLAIVMNSKIAKSGTNNLLSRYGGVSKFFSSNLKELLHLQKLGLAS
jgi:hypothetical protein